MLRSIVGVGLLVSVLVPALADPPAEVTSPSPKIRLAQVVDGKLIVEEHWSTTQDVTETRTITENGVTKTVNVVVTVNVLRATRDEHLLRDVKAFDMDGREVTRGRVEHMLRERMAVVIMPSGGKLDPAFRKLLRDDTLVLVPPLPVLP